MERKRPEFTPEQYTRAIVSLSRRYSTASVFPGNNYLDIAEWMLQERSLLSSPKVGADPKSLASKSEPHHDLVVVYNSGDKKWAVQHYDQLGHDAFFTTGPVPEDGSGQIVFIRGLLSPSWVSSIGSKYRVDPEFFRRHMEFLTVSIDRHAYSSPSLASASDNIFRLCVSTVLHRDDLGEQNILEQRKDQFLQLKTYKIQQLGNTKVSCGDSLVRNYSTLDSSFSVLEQWISICITKQNKGWTVIAWMDQGRSLEKSPPGPWTSHLNSKATALPILQSHSKMAFRTTTSRLDTESNETAEVQQSATILPLQYDSVLALVDLARRASQDPLSMCIPLFTHAAFSEVQFLNLIESRIRLQIDAISEGLPADAVGTFHFFSKILHRHVIYLKDSLHALRKIAERSGQSSNWSKTEIQSSISRSTASPNLTVATRSPSYSGVLRSPSPSPDIETARLTTPNGGDGAFAANGLLDDYEELHVRCVDLSELCTRGITLAMNKASIDESHKAMEQSERLKKLTLLATFFIPLSFCSSLFGMNLDVFSQSTVRVWWFFVLCVPMTLLTYMLYLWDWQAVKQFSAKAVRHFHNNKLKERVDGIEKDSNYRV